EQLDRLFRAVHAVQQAAQHLQADGLTDRRAGALERGYRRVQGVDGWLEVAPGQQRPGEVRARPRHAGQVVRLLGQGECPLVQLDRAGWLAGAYPQGEAQVVEVGHLARPVVELPRR